MILFPQPSGHIILDPNAGRFYNSSNVGKHQKSQCSPKFSSFFWQMSMQGQKMLKNIKWFYKNNLIQWNWILQLDSPRPPWLSLASLSLDGRILPIREDRVGRSFCELPTASSSVFHMLTISDKCSPQEACGDANKGWEETADVEN